MNTSDLLCLIEMKSEVIRAQARDLAEYTSMLAYRRPFLTKAEAAMQEAEVELELALRTIRACQEQYSKKEVGLG